MKDRKELVKDMKNIQKGFDEMNRKIGQVRQRTIEMRIKVDNSEVEPDEFSRSLDEMVDVLSLVVEKIIQGVIDEIRCLQGEMKRR